MKEKIREAFILAVNAKVEDLKRDLMVAPHHSKILVACVNGFKITSADRFFAYSVALGLEKALGVQTVVHQHSDYDKDAVISISICGKSLRSLVEICEPRELQEPDDGELAEASAHEEAYARREYGDPLDAA